MMLIVLLLVSCTNDLSSLPQFAHDDASLVVVSYNVGNLFDAEHDGSEYREFIPSEDWTLRSYQQRKLEIATALENIRPVPDLIFLQEVENDRVAEDLQRDLRWYRWRATTEHRETATEVALLSKYPLRNLRAHHPYDENVALRPILEAEIIINGERFFCFVNHWKSKRGGAEETEALRIRSAELLKERISALSGTGAVIAAGDFNEEPWESSLREYRTALASDAEAGVIHTAPPGSTSASILVSPWYGTSEGGSYLYQGDWQAIDGFLLSAAVFEQWEVEDFFVWNNAQASDHLPVVLVLKSRAE